MDPETVRLRAVFKGGNMLSKSQKSSGLKRSWLLLKPQHQTISDLASDLLRAFGLENACPNGIIVSMDGYVLPPFESTRLLKDNDIISLTKKRAVLADRIPLGDGRNSLELKIAEKQPVPTGLKLLADEEFKKETGGCESEPGVDEEGQSEDGAQVETTPTENKASKKRKDTKELRSPKSKRTKHTTIEKHPDSENVGDCIAKQGRNSVCDLVLSKKNFAKKDGVCLVQDKKSKLNASKIDERSMDSSKSSHNVKRSRGLEQNGEKHVDASQTPGGPTKVSSRSARRKKAKRQWLKVVNHEKKKLHEKQISHHDDQNSPDKNNYVFSKKPQRPDQNNEAPQKAVHIFCGKHQKSDRNSGAEECYGPVVIRPGHIRFKPLGEDHDVQPKSQAPVDSFQWNGTTSNKKGPKWGMLKFSSTRGNANVPWLSRMRYTEEGLILKGPLDFDKLAPYASSPKAGDVIAYRLIELSSSWTPELSSFRVGKISRYYSQSNHIVLVPVPEYPIAFKEGDEGACESQPDTSLYAEDGTLKISFSCLINIRSVKRGNLDSRQVITGAVSQDGPSKYRDKSCISTQENGDVWERISQASNAMKAQLPQENDVWSKKENDWSTTPSFRT